MIAHSPEINELAAALAKAQSEFPVILKEKQGKIKGQSKSGNDYEYTYKYADIAAVLKAVIPCLAKNDIVAIQPTVTEDGGVYVHTRLIHKSGQWIESTYPVCGVSGDHQKMGAALTYARRYALSSMVGVASDDDVDGEGTGDLPPPKHPRNKPEPRFSRATDAQTDNEVEQVIRLFGMVKTAENLGDLWKSARVQALVKAGGPEAERVIAAKDQRKAELSSVLLAG
jgi:hypothetical protein